MDTPQQLAIILGVACAIPLVLPVLRGRDRSPVRQLWLPEGSARTTLRKLLLNTVIRFVALFFLTMAVSAAVGPWYDDNRLLSLTFTSLLMLLGLWAAEMWLSLLLGPGRPRAHGAAGPP